MEHGVVTLKGIAPVGSLAAVSLDLLLPGEVLNFDTIIYATGFVTVCLWLNGLAEQSLFIFQQDSFPLPIRGKNKYIQEYYKSEGGPTAYLGVCTPGFPNFFIFSGGKYFL